MAAQSVQLLRVDRRHGSNTLNLQVVVANDRSVASLSSMWIHGCLAVLP
jgi:acetolactate synthase regulatory subunit